MKFQYIGDGNSSPLKTTAFGCFFILNGEPVDVADPLAVEKLSNNRCFVSEQAAADPDGDYIAQLDDAIPEAILSDLAFAEQPVVEPPAEATVPRETVPVVTTYAKRGRPPKGPSRT